MDTITEIKFECVKCGQRMAVDSSAAGMNTDCPACGTSVTIPKKDGFNDRRPRSRENVADPEIAALRAQLAAVKADAEKSDASARHSQSEFKSERLALRNEAAQLRQKLDAARADAEAARDEANRLTGELALSQRETETAAEQLRIREIEFTELCTQIAGAQAERTAARRENQTLTAQRAHLEADLATARADLAAAAGERATAEELAQAQAQLSTAGEYGKALGAEVEALKTEAAGLRRSISENTTGRELLETRAQLAAVETERDRALGETRQLRADQRAQDTAAQQLDEQCKTLRRQLDEAKRAAEERLESRLSHDNDVLRGIVSRQNVDLENKHLEVTRLKRARFALRLVYAGFALALIGIGVLAVKYIPALRF